MKFTPLICFFIFLINSAVAEAQDKYGRPALVSGIAELYIGDQVPDILIDKIINNDKRSIRTSDYKDKLLILDFWDTSCSSCILSMPKLDSLQQVFDGQIKLLSVTWQAENKITDFFKTNRYLKEQKTPVHRPSVVEDRMLASYFPHKGVPHVVWIYKGKVTAITDGTYINGINVKSILDNKAINWPLKNDSFDTTRPFMTLDALSQDGTESAYYGYAVLTGQTASVPSIGGINFLQDTIMNRSRIAIFNQSIFHAYQMLLVNTRSGRPTFLTTPGRTFLEVKEPYRYFYKDEYGDRAEWDRKHLICYEQVKQGFVDKLVMAKLAVQDLNSRLGVNGRYEMRKVKCLVFVRTDRPITNTLEIKQGGTSIPALVMMHLDIQRKFPPAIDETGFEGGLRMETYDGTVAGLRKEMQRHGLDLIEAEREIEVLVISDDQR